MEGKIGQDAMSLVLAAKSSDPAELERVLIEDHDATSAAEAIRELVDAVLARSGEVLDLQLRLVAAGAVICETCERYHSADHHDPELICECGFPAATRAGLMAHRRNAHPNAA